MIQFDWVLWHINYCRLFNVKSIFIQIVLFKTIQFSMSTQFVKNISISSNSVQSNSSNSNNSVLFNPLIGPSLLGATITGQSGPGSNGNEAVLRIPQSPSITGTSLSDCLVSYPGHSLLVYLTAPADWAIHRIKC